jgi:hypothetical protein
LEYTATGLNLPKFDETKVDKEFLESAKRNLRDAETKLEAQYAQKIKKDRNPETGITPKVLRTRVDYAYGQLKDSD